MIANQPKFRLYNVRNATVLRCAVLYSLGRQTYMPKLVADELKPLLLYIPPHVLRLIRRDIMDCKNYGDDCDEMTWMDFLQDVNNALDVHRRKEPVPPLEKPVDLERDFFGCVLSAAVRYSLYQDDSFSEDTITCLSPFLPYLSTKTLGNMYADVLNYPSCTSSRKKLWAKFLSELETELERKERK